MKIKLLKNFWTKLGVFKAGRTVSGEMLAELDRRYSIDKIVKEGIAEIIEEENSTELIEPVKDESFQIVEKKKRKGK